MLNVTSPNPSEPGVNRLNELTLQDPSPSAFKGELMLIWCLLGFLEQPFGHSVLHCSLFPI